MYTYQQRLEYAKQLQRLQKAVVIKDNIHLTYKYQNQNKAIANAHSLQDKIIKSIVDDVVSGNADSIKNIDSKVEKLLTKTLENERKRIHNKKDRYVDNAVEQNTRRYSEILSNRINQESIKLEAKIESEIRSGMHKKLTEAETRQELLNKYGDTGKARIKNIIHDSVHTNESNISFIDALNKGYNYKVWMNGRGKGKTRPWHKANLIMPVPIDEYFDIYGSYHAQLMYPGDLYGGAENVANCRCWLRYTNNVPENFKKKTTFNVNPSYQNIWDKTINFTGNLNNNIKKPIHFLEKIILNTPKKIKNIFTKNINIPKLFHKIVSKIDSYSIKINVFGDKENLQYLIDKGEASTSFGEIIYDEDTEKYYGLNKTEKVIKYEFHKDNLIIYESVDVTESKVMEIKLFYDKLPDKLKVAKEIILSNQRPYIITDGEKEYVGGYYPKDLTQVILFQEELFEVKGNLVHELAHGFDKNYVISNSEKYREAFNEDMKILVKIPGITPTQTFITKYAFAFYNKANKKGSKYSHRKLSEDFSECVKFYIMMPEKLRFGFKNKYKFIDDLLHYYDN